MLRSFAFYGTVAPQLAETQGAVSRLWCCAFDEAASSQRIDTRRANILAAGLPATLDISQWLFEPTDVPPQQRSAAEIDRIDALRPDARTQLQALPDLFGPAWQHVDSLVLIDEPNLPAHRKSAATLQQAARLVRSLFPGKRLAVIYYTGAPLVGLDLFDWVGIDRYKDGDKVLWDGWPRQLRWLRKWGWARHLQRQLRDDQDLILVPGGGEPEFPAPKIHKWVRYAQRQRRGVHLVGFIWRAPRYAHSGMVGIANRPGLAADYLAAGRAALGTAAKA